MGRTIHRRQLINSWRDHHLDNDSNTFKVNGQRLKFFLEHSHNINQEIDEIDLISFNEFIANL